MRVDLFDFELPDDRIALRPAVPRDAAKMLVVDREKPLLDTRVSSLPDFLATGDVVVLNDTRVIPAQFEGVRRREDNELKVSATFHMREAGHIWKAFIRPAKRIREDDQIIFSNSSGDKLECSVTEKGDAGEVTLTFDMSSAELDAKIAEVGRVPLPPYIASKRGEDGQDKTDYQTIYAQHEGAVAAPTAGLHFTDHLFDALKSKGVEIVFVTLHVGAGTFLPVKADDTDYHKMHAEIGYVSAQVADQINKARQDGNRVVSVGTTSLRLLESAVDDKGQVQPWSGATDIFITPGYQFKAVDMLMTNFHLPKSTLFMLVSAFSGLNEMKAAYAHAIAEEYRFYSFGDSSLLYLKP